MDTKTITERVAENFIAGKTPEALKKHQFTKNDPDNPNPKGSDKDGDGKTNEKKPDFIKDKKSSDVPRGVVAALTSDGVIKIYAADNAEAADGIKTALMEQEGEYAAIAHGPNREGMNTSELYDHFEQRWMEAKTEKHTFKVPRDIKGDNQIDMLVATMQNFFKGSPKNGKFKNGVITINGEMKEQKGKTKSLDEIFKHYVGIAKKMTPEDARGGKKYATDAEYTAGCEKLPAGGMRDNCEKKSKGGDKKDDSKGDDKKDDAKGDKKDDKKGKGGLPPWLEKGKGDKKDDKKKKSSECGCSDDEEDDD